MCTLAAIHTPRLAHTHTHTHKVMRKIRENLIFVGNGAAALLARTWKFERRRRLGGAYRDREEKNGAGEECERDLPLSRAREQLNLLVLVYFSHFAFAFAISLASLSYSPFFLSLVPSRILLLPLDRGLYFYFSFRALLRAPLRTRLTSFFRASVYVCEISSIFFSSSLISGVCNVRILLLNGGNFVEV